MTNPWRKPEPQDALPDPEQKLRTSDPTGLALRASTALIFTRKAFVGIQPDEHYERTRTILGEPVRADRGTQWDQHNPLLPNMRCGCEGLDGRRCGKTIKPSLGTSGMYYNSHECRLPVVGHASTFGRELETFVLAMLVAVLPTDSLGGAVETVEFRLKESRRRLDRINRRIRQLEVELEEVSRAELESRRQDCDEDKLHFATLRKSLRIEETRLLTDARVLSDRLAAFSDGEAVAALAARVRALAADLPTLLERSRDVHGLTASLVGSLTNSIAIASLSSHVLLIEIVFLDQTVARRLVVSGRFFCTQPQRAAAFALRSSGVDAKVTLQQLTPTSTRFPAYRVWTAREMDTLALFHRYFETASERPGPHQTVRQLGRALTLDEADVRSVVLMGSLGPLRVDDAGAWLLSPTEEEMQQVSIDRARRSIARTRGWRVSDCYTTSELAVSLGVSGTSVTNTLMNYPHASARDLVGRIFLNQRALPDKWRVRPDTAARVAETIQRAFETTRCAIVVAAGHDASMADDFIPIGDLVHQLRANTGRCSQASLSNAARKGSILQVSYDGPTSRPNTKPPKVLIHCPPAIRDSRDPQVVLEWMGGRARQRASIDRQMRSRREKR